MVEILVQGDDADGVARDVAVAIQEIFAIDPLISTRDGGTRLGTRSLEAALLVLAIPPAVAAGRDIIKHWDVPTRWSRLLRKIESLRKDKDATLMIDIGNGKLIPLHEANRDQIYQALKILEAHLKS